MLIRTYLVLSASMHMQVDVLHNNQWWEGYVSKVSKAGQITVHFPGDDESGAGSLIVFQDTSGQCWIREPWNKTKPKRTSVRCGWCFSPTGHWRVRGQTDASDTAFEVGSDNISCTVRSLPAQHNSRHHRKHMLGSYVNQTPFSL